MQTSLWYCTTCGAANDGLDTHCFACTRPHIEDATETSGANMLQGRYRLLTQVGVGGFGVVYRAIDTQSADQIVAIKQINLRGLSPQKMIEATDAFNREVQHLTPLQHRPRCFYSNTSPSCHRLVARRRPVCLCPRRWFFRGSLLHRCRRVARVPHQIAGSILYRPNQRTDLVARRFPTSPLTSTQETLTLICSGRPTARASPWKSETAICRSGIYGAILP